MSLAKYKDVEKHFTLAVTNYSPDNVAEKFQQTISTKSAVLVKKGQCHWSMSQIKEAINAFKMAKQPELTLQVRVPPRSGLFFLRFIYIYIYKI